MKSLVVYDSNFGNTKIIAEAIAAELGKESGCINIRDFTPKDLQGIALFVAGSPINGWRPAPNMIAFLDTLSDKQLQGIKTAAFDTRINVFFHGDAAGKIAKKLVAAGGKNIAEPGLFFVKGKEGPLADGEVDKAKAWAKNLLDKAEHNTRS